MTVIRSRWLVVVTVLCAVLSSPAGHAADDVTPEASSATELLLVEMRLNGRLLADFEDVLESPDGRLWLPLEPLVRAAEGEFAEIETGRYRAAMGAALPEVQIDTVNRHLLIDGSRHDWPEDAIRTDGQQLFVDQVLLETLFTLTAELTDDRLRVEVDSARPLPADLRRLRERRWQRFGREDVTTDRPHLDVERPYALWGTPRGNLRLSTNTSQRDSRLRSNVGGSVEVEAGYLSNRIFFSGDDRGGLRSLRWTGGRISPEGHAFGIPGVYRLEAGDVAPLRLPLAGGSRSGRGVLFSTAPMARPELFDVIRIDGDALPGWDVELYRGSELIDFQRIGDDGRYDFDDVPLGFGTNAFRVVLYGPQGQVEEREISRAIPGGQLLPGELHLRGGYVQTGRSMVNPDGRQQESGELTTLRADFGLMRRLTASLLFSAEREPDAESRRQHVGLAMRPALGALRSELVVLHQDEGALAAQVDAGFAVAGTSVSAGYSHFDRAFVSRQRVVGGRSFDERLRLRVGRSLGRLGTVRLGSLSLQYDRYSFVSGARREEYQPRWAHSVGAVSVSHEFNQVRNQEGAVSTRYRLLASHRRGPVSSRLQMTAAGRQPEDMTVGTVSGAIDYRLDDRRTVGSSASYNVNGGGYGFGARYSQQFGAGQLGLSGSSNDRGVWSLGLTLAVGLGMERPLSLSLMPPGHAGAGAVALSVFEDLDGDGRFVAERDRPLAGVGFLVNDRPHPAVTDAQGRVVLRPLSTDRPVRIALDPNAMEDPFLTTVSPRLQLQPRPGYTHTLQMPLVDSALVTGTVLRGDRPVAGVVVIARRSDGMAEETTRSLSDGYFAFETLSPGDWVFEVASGALPDGWQSTSVSQSLEPGGAHDGLIIHLQPPDTTEESAHVH